MEVKKWAYKTIIGQEFLRMLRFHYYKNWELINITHNPKTYYLKRRVK